MNRLFPIVCALLSGAAAGADPIETEDYQVLRAELTRRIDFDRLPQRPEPGFNLDKPIYSEGAWLGERFRGQTLTVSGTRHDAVAHSPLPDSPLTIVPGAPRQNLNIAFHRGFGSNAIFPIGPAGFPDLAARGEGALAILFIDDQAAFGFRVHTDYPDPLGTHPVPGKLVVLVFRRDGSLVSRLEHQAGTGISEFGYRRSGGLRDIGGVLLLNTDPGGIAVDDIIFAPPPLVG